MMPLMTKLLTKAHEETMVESPLTNQTFLVRRVLSYRLVRAKDASMHILVSPLEMTMSLLIYRTAMPVPSVVNQIVLVSQRTGALMERQQVTWFLRIVFLAVNTATQRITMKVLFKKTRPLMTTDWQSNAN